MSCVQNTPEKAGHERGHNLRCPHTRVSLSASCHQWDGEEPSVWGVLLQGQPEQHA